MKWLQRDLEELGTKPTLVSHIGDIAYVRGYSWLWDSFFQQVEPVGVSTPWHRQPQVQLSFTAFQA